MPQQACPHCNSSHLSWYKTLNEWIFAVEALGIEYDSHLAYEMMTASPSFFWLCGNCRQGGMAMAGSPGVPEPAEGSENPGVMVVAPLTFRGTTHLMAGHTSTYARERCEDYRRAAAMVRPTIVAGREAAGLHKDGGDDDAFAALASEATGFWLDTNRMTLAQASIGDLPAALRIAMCFTHAFADVVWDELGESVDEVCGEGDQARLDTLVALWVELQGSKVNKPVSRKAKQKAEARLRVEASRKRK